MAGELQAKEDYDEVVKILEHACSSVCCNECAFDVPESEVCARECLLTMIVAMRGRAQSLKDVPTCDLVKEIAAREGVTEYTAGPQDRYLVRTKADDGVSRVDFDLGPATILVVVD